MKKKLIFDIIYFIIICMLTGYLIANYYDAKAKYGKYGFDQTKTDIKKELATTKFDTIIYYDKLKQYVADNKQAMVVIGKDNCKYCKMFKPILDSTKTQYGYNYMYINLSLLTDAEYNDLMDSKITLPESCSGYENKNFTYRLGTPTTIFFEDTKSFDCLIGYTKEENLIKKIKSVGILKEK